MAAIPQLLRSLRHPFPKPFKPSSLPFLRRAFSLCDQINLIDQVSEDRLRFENLSVFKILRPSPDILILGCGRNIQHAAPELRHFIRSHVIKLVAVDSRNAASTYNILNEEGRVVAAAFIPYGTPD